MSSELAVRLYSDKNGALGKKAFCRIFKIWFISWIMGQNVQKLQIFAIFASQLGHGQLIHWMADRPMCLEKLR